MEEFGRMMYGQVRGRGSAYPFHLNTGVFRCKEGPVFDGKGQPKAVPLWLTSKGGSDILQQMFFLS